jgi:hypothetical protein
MSRRREQQVAEVAAVVLVAIAPHRLRRGLLPMMLVSTFTSQTLYPVNARSTLLGRLPLPWGLLYVSLRFVAPHSTIVALGGAL